MKQKILVFLKYFVLLNLVWGAEIGATYLYTYYIESRLFIWEVKRIWGDKKFEATKFQHAGLDERFAMAANLIKKKYGIGWSKKRLSVF